MVSILLPYAKVIAGVGLASRKLLRLQPVDQKSCSLDPTAPLERFGRITTVGLSPTMLRGITARVVTAVRRWSALSAGLTRLPVWRIVDHCPAFLRQFIVGPEGGETRAQAAILSATGNSGDNFGDNRRPRPFLGR